MARHVERRRFLAVLAGFGLASTRLPDLLWARAQVVGPVTVADVEGAEAIAGLSLTPDEREMLVGDLREHRLAFERIRSVDLPFDVAPALRFDVDLDRDPGRDRGADVEVGEGAGAGDGASDGPAAGSDRWTRHPDLVRPPDLETLAFRPLTEVAELVRERRVTSVELTEMYLGRLRRYGTRLECVVTLTEARALDRARRADEEIAAGRYRSPLHGIPWGAKDLLAANGYPTTWGAEPYRDQVIEEDAGVVRRLDEAGAVLVAKLALGALAMGDVWYGGRTRNPWSPDRGSSGSSSGPAAAVAAGLVGFAVGSETLGSIVSPSARCGATGLRPTFGRVGRSGAMPLAWSMDKIGPVCRGAEDCALVLSAIHGRDPADPSARTVPFRWDAEASLEEIRVGYLPEAFGGSPTGRFAQRTLEVLRSLGVRPVPVALPGEFPAEALRIILEAEAAAAFDVLTRSGRDDSLVRQDPAAWPNIFRSARFIPAVEYIQANRVRTLLAEGVRRALEEVDVVVTPPFAGDVLLVTNLTGHPAVVVPNGFRDDGTPVAMSFVGRPWKEAEALTLAHAYQGATAFHGRIPPNFS